MEILFLTYNNSDSCAFYRSSGILKDLRGKIGLSHNISVAQWSDINMTWSFISQFDMVMFSRPATPDALNLCQFIKSIGVKLWVDWEDNFFEVNPENEKAFEFYSPPEIQKSMSNIISIADVVTVPTDGLKTVLSGLNENIVVIPNAFNDTLLKRPLLSRRTNNIIWRGSKSHIKDLSMYARPINNLAQEFKDWRFIFMGYNPWFLEGSPNKAKIPMQDIIAYHRAIFGMAPALFHVPLDENPFNRCRDIVAAIEAGYAGAIAVVPEWWNVPGTITYKDPDTYYEAIRAVLAGEVDIVIQNMMLWDYVREERLLSKVNVKRLEIIESLV